MPRIRTIKPEFFASQTVARLPHRARLTFVGLWTYVDDKGRGQDESRLIKAALWPLDDDVTAADVAADLSALADAGLIERWHEPTLDRNLLRVRGLLEHQRIDKPTASKLPLSPEESKNTLGVLPEASTSSPSRKGREGTDSGDLADAAAALVEREPQEARDLADELTARYGAQTMRQAFEQLPRRRHMFTSQLRSALEPAIARIISERPACDRCEAVGMIYVDQDRHELGCVPCPDCATRAQVAS